MASRIQATEGQLTTGGALTLTWPSGAPTDGNLLVGVFTSANNPSTRLTPTGWTKITTTEFHSDTSAPTQPRGDMYYRIASSEGTTVDWNTSEAGDRSKLAWMAEFDGIPGSPAAPDHAILSGDGTNVSTRSTGTASTSKSDYLAIAAWVWVNATTVTFTSATNSISLEAEEFINVANDKGIIVGYNLTGALESTLTFGGPADSDIGGAIAVFEIDSTGQAVGLNVLTVTPTFYTAAVALGAAPGGGVEERQMMMGM